MTFDLLPHLTPFLVLLAVVAVLGAASLVAAAVPAVARNHRVRVRRQEGLFTYYGHLVAGH